MKKLLLSSLAGLILTSGSALAADLYAPAPAPAYKAPPPPPPAISWTGCYIDGGVGYALWDQKHYEETYPGLVTVTPTINSGGEGWLGRLGGGCDFQTPLFNNRVVIGAFADYDFMSASGTFQDSFSGDVGTETETGSWAAGGRIGYLVTPWLLGYADGGYTQARFGQVNFSSDTVPSVALPFGFSANTYRGWFLGGGTEYALNMDWIPIRGLFWRTEYRYASYQSADIPIVFTPTGTSVGFAEHMQKDMQTITSGLVWRFNFGGPIATRY